MSCTPIILTLLSFQVHPATLVPHPQKEKKTENKTHQVQFVLLIYSLEHGQMSCFMSLISNQVKHARVFIHVVLTACCFY